ncbi:MAG TPA: hypothetical protein GX009_04870 [Candidatus Atribacteria bacterium]|jgi:hypothetical protein|nr:hypothetical protein [Candidatus Atribacteria bacterium]
MYKLDEETKDILRNARSLIIRETKNISYLLKEIGNKSESTAKIIGTHVFAVGSEVLTFQILENLNRSFLLIAIIGLRTLLENYINVHYIYHHPDHLDDVEWAEFQCKDYVKRSLDPQAQKSKIGEKSLYQRAKLINFEDLYIYVYSELCNYSHFLANSLDSTAIPSYFKAKTIETAIYTITFYQDILIAISSFYETSFDVFVDDIFLFKNKGQAILSNINCRKDYIEFKENIKKLKYL